ncbi:uncharacterized protein N7483_013169 [Penicillium malachiteum]|uniref:uncharacterized protein n=1 Tax=Penicillium malachiteum TaxID=1324776 RepID=UPI002547DF22|nr:uncharacterized protein N7483_013169 [Penicillium malachiteum]KAJ5715988.1 hypothetical protein N7483_013169 [Penicillium malachiteum]
MDQLPLEIRYIIADWTRHISKKTLQALCLVNREWNEIARILLYRHITIHLREGKIANIPDDQRILAHVRQLSLVAKWQPGAWHKTLHLNHTQPLVEDKTRGQNSQISRALEGAFSGDHFVPRAGFYVRGDWSPIIDLIRRIPCLHDVNIVVFHGGPVELFEALSQYHPSCRVSIFSTLIKENPIQTFSFPIIDPVWLSSPMLYAVHLTCLEGFPRFYEHPDRVLQNIVLHAPNLKKIALRISDKYNSPTGQEQLNRANVDIGAKSDKPPGSARIETMSWPLHTKMTAVQFQDWQTITDFSVLRSLNAGCIEDLTLLRSMVNMRPFRQLQRLTLALFPPKDNKPRFWQVAESMFSSLPPLTHLCLLGMYTPEFANNMLGCKHGQTLLELELHREIVPHPRSRGISLSRLCQKGQAGPIFSTEHVRELADHCPSLQKLQVCVQRCPGAQTDLSRALSRFPCLEKLDLVLNCLPEMDANMMPVPLRELTDFEKGLASDFKWGSDVCPRWFIRDYIINCVMSESLVKQFFTQIHTSQERLVQLVISPLIGEWAQCSKLDQYSCFPNGVMKFIKYPLFNTLASVWKVEQENHTELHAIREKPFDPPLLDKKWPNEILSIVRSTGIWKTGPDVETY